MRTYLSTFISGFQNPVERLLKEKIHNVKIDLLLDGLVIYRTDQDVNKIKNLEFFNNSFFVLKSFQHTNEESLEKILQRVSEIRNINKSIRPFLTRKNKSFKIMVSQENRLVSVNKNLLQKIESKVKRLRLNIKNPDTELWLLKRREDVAFFMLRLTKNTSNKNLEKGELRPELAYLLCALSEPSKEDIFLDPFSGHGAIPITRARFFPAKMVFATDKQQNYKQYLNPKIVSRTVREKIIPKTLDARKMDFFEEGYITKIVTDPPWGEYEKIDDTYQLYKNMLKEFSRVLMKKGTIILLTSKKEDFEKALKNFKSLLLKEKYDILVSGKKAGVYKIIKN